MKRKSAQVVGMEHLEMKLDLFKEHIDGKIDTVSERLNKMDERLSKVDTTLVGQAAVLEEHVRRTNLLEKKIEDDKKDLDKKLDDEKKDLDTKIEPIKQHVAGMKIFLRILGYVAGTGGIIGGAGLGVSKLVELIFGGM